MPVFRVVLEGLGPFKDKVEFEVSTPVTVLVGDSGTGKTFILRILELLSKLLAEERVDVNRIEHYLVEEFGGPESIVNHEVERGRVMLEVQGELVLDLEVGKVVEPFRRERDVVRGRFTVLRTWRAEDLFRELGRNTVVAVDVRVALVRAALAGRAYPAKPVEDVYFREFSEMLVRKEDYLYLSFSLLPAEKAGLLSGGNVWSNKVVGGVRGDEQSAAVLSLLSLAPVIKRLLEGRGLFAAVDTVELHLTPLFQGAVMVNLGRMAKMEWASQEEELAATPLLVTTHSSLVLASLAREIDEGVKDVTVVVSDEFKLSEDDVKTLVLYREDGKIVAEEHKGVVPPDYMREYRRVA